MVGKIETFLDMFRKHLPEMFPMFAASTELLGTNQESAVIRSIYSRSTKRIFQAKFSKNVRMNYLSCVSAKSAGAIFGEPRELSEHL